MDVAHHFREEDIREMRARFRRVQEEAWTDHLVVHGRLLTTVVPVVALVALVVLISAAITSFTAPAVTVAGHTAVQGVARPLSHQPGRNGAPSAYQSAIPRAFPHRPVQNGVAPATAQRGALTTTPAAARQAAHQEGVQ
jgi:hypothetical protein